MNAAKSNVARRIIVLFSFSMMLKHIRFILYTLEGREAYRMELMKPIPEFPVNLMFVTAIALIGVLIALRVRDSKAILH